MFADQTGIQVDVHENEDRFS